MSDLDMLLGSLNCFHHGDCMAAGIPLQVTPLNAIRRFLRWLPSIPASSQSLKDLKFARGSWVNWCI